MTILDRLLALCVENETGCWEAQGYTHNGYKFMYEGGRRFRAHRLTYEHFIGDIPEGLDLDHLCRNRACVNPWHLDPVTRRVNLLRGETLPAANAAKTHCAQGHEYAPENTRFRSNGDRVCRSCDMARKRANWAKRRDEYNAARRARRKQAQQAHERKQAS